MKPEMQRHNEISMTGRTSCATMTNKSISVMNDKPYTISTCFNLSNQRIYENLWEIWIFQIKLDKNICDWIIWQKLLAKCVCFFFNFCVCNLCQCDLLTTILNVNALDLSLHHCDSFLSKRVPTRAANASAKSIAKLTRPLNRASLGGCDSLYFNAAQTRRRWSYSQFSLWKREILTIRAPNCWTWRQCAQVYFHI